MKKRIFLTFLLGLVFIRMFSQQEQVLKNVLENGLAQNGTDQSEELIALLADDTHLFFPKGKYHFTETIRTDKLENFTIEGEPGTEIITTRPILFKIGGPMKNIAFKNISIKSTDATASSRGQLSLIHSNEQNIANLLLEDVFMSAPKSATNGIKFINERNTKTKGVVFRRFKVDSIGRMGLEIQNHHRQRTIAETSRYEDILIIDSEFTNTGLREYGMGVSVGGLGKNVQVLNSSFTNSSDRALEFIGTDGVTIQGNCFQDNFASIVVTRNEIVTGLRTKNVTFSNNVMDNSEGEGFLAIEDLSMDNNTFRQCGRIKFADIKGAEIRSLTVDTEAYAALTIDGLKDFLIQDAQIKNRRAGNNLIRLEGERSELKIYDSTLFPGKGQWPYDDVEATNTIIDFKNVKVYDSEGRLTETLGLD